MPLTPLDLFNSAFQSVAGGAASNNPNSVPPASSGDGSRQNRIPPNRPATHVRNLVRWFVPETGIIDMYINPQQLIEKDKKGISSTRTKGGFVNQYWGEELTTLSISGTTGSSGVEGINVLRDIYRSEQVAFDPYALAIAAQLDAQNQRSTFLGDSQRSVLDAFGTGIGQGFLDQVNNALLTGTNPSRPRPTLASLAFTVEMYWSGWTYRGYFADFSVTENAEKIGLFDYSMTFMVTQKRGYRSNFFGWHRSPTSGPSNSDPVVGVPHSFSGLTNTLPTVSGTLPAQRGISLNESLQTSNGYVGDPGFSSIF